MSHCVSRQNQHSVEFGGRNPITSIGLGSGFRHGSYCSVRAGLSMRSIGRHLHRTASTISHELRRYAATCSGGLEYRASTAQWHGEERAAVPLLERSARTTVSRRPSGPPQAAALTKSNSFPKSVTTSYRTRSCEIRRPISAKNFRAQSIFVFSISRSMSDDMEPLVSATK